jgi:outer membrane protein assembly factor BamB
VDLYRSDRFWRHANPFSHGSRGLCFAEYLSRRWERGAAVIVCGLDGSGRHEVPWDGLATPLASHSGEPLPAGNYAWKAIFHEGLGVKLRGWACNGGERPWDSAGGRGDWGGNRGIPSAVAADGERVYLGWTLDETGRVVVACDLDGRALWSHRSGAAEGCKALAVDDGLVYVLGGAEGEDAEGGSIFRLRASDGTSVPWPSGAAGLKITSLWPADGKPKPHCADAMAVRTGRIYLSFTEAQFMSVLDAKSGVYLETVVGAPPGAVDATPTKTELPGKPGVMVDADFAVTALHGGVLGKLLLNHDPMWIVASDLTPLQREERITALTVLGDGAKFHRHDVFLGLDAPFHQVEARPILQAEGFTWIVGRSGGRSLLGPWQPDGLRNIRAVALDGAGRLWVAEGDGFPKRFSVWDTDGKQGKLAREFFGSAERGARGGAIFPNDPNIMVGQGCEWRLDPKTGKASCLGVITREGMDSARFGAGPNGRVYLVVAHSENGPVSIFERVADGDYRMRARIFLADAQLSELPASAPGEAATAQTVFWADENGDGKQQRGELHAAPGAWRFGGWSLPVTSDLTLCGTNPRREHRGFQFKLAGWTACGAPLYDFAHPGALPAFGESSADGRFTLQWDDEGRFVCWDAQTSRVRWTYPAEGGTRGNGETRMMNDDGRGTASGGGGLEIGGAAGRIFGTCGACGCVKLPAPLGNVWVIPTQAGDWHLLTEDGFYLSRIFESDPTKVQWPANAAPGADMSRASLAAKHKPFGGSVTLGADGKVYLQAGQTAFWNLELTGLETVRGLAEGRVTLSGDRKAETGNRKESGSQR